MFFDSKFSVLVFVTEGIDHRGMTGSFLGDYMFERKPLTTK